MSEPVRPPKIAMVVSRFPKVSEMFQLREMVALSAMDVPIELYSLIHHEEESVHDDAVAFDRRANYFKLLSFEVLKAQITWIRRNPRGYFAAWKWGLIANRKAPEFWVRNFFVIPVAAAMALRMEKTGIEHVHAHFATYPTHAAMVIKMLTGIPYSFTGHAHDLRLRLDGLGDKISESEFFFCCTAFSAADLHAMFGGVAEKCHVVHHGVDLDTFTFSEPPPDDGERDLRLVCVAGFEECKGHEYLFSAAKTLKDRGIGFELTLIGGNLPGDPEGENRLRARCDELGIAEFVTFTGRIPSSEVQRWVERSDIGVLPCCRTPQGNMDGLPNFLTETSATGRPVVSTTMPGVMELITDGQEGLLVEPRNAEDLAEALIKLRNDPALRAQMGKAGRATVEAHHNVVENTKKLYDVYIDRVGRPA